MLKELGITGYYRTKVENFSSNVVIPLLKVCDSYDRGTGYFSIRVLADLAEGLLPFIKNNGSIRLVTSVELEETDRNIFVNGYEKAKNIITSELIKQIESELVAEENNISLDLITNLIAVGRIKIKIGFIPDGGIYHEKIAFFKKNNETVFFAGSQNETHAAYKDNVESVWVVGSWGDSRKDVLKAEKNFELLWNNNLDSVMVFDFPEAVKNNLFKRFKKSDNVETCINIIETKELINTNCVKEGPIKLKELYPFQQKAIDEFFCNNCKYFYEMATGTGKTFTALKTIEKISTKYEKTFISILVPQIDLQNQWLDAINEFGFPVYLFGGNNTNTDWEDCLNKALIQYFSDNGVVILLCVYDTYFTKLRDVIVRYKNITKMIIVDEAHELSLNQINMLDADYSLRLGLSATPERYVEDETKKILDYFTDGKQNTFKYTLADAIQNGFLARYWYTPIFVHLTPNEFESFKKDTLLIKRLQFMEPIDKKRIQEISNRRSLIIKKASNKLIKLRTMIEGNYSFKNSVVYCGQGKETEKTTTIIDEVTKYLTQYGNYKVSQYTCFTDNRFSVLKAFERGDYDTLVAIKCFDEGVDVPKLDKIYVMASDNSLRQTIQRRGRVLRKSIETGKKIAFIYDFVVLPPEEVYDEVVIGALLNIELKRFNEYKSLSENNEELNPISKELKTIYSIQEFNND